MWVGGLFVSFRLSFYVVGNSGVGAMMMLVMEYHSWVSWRECEWSLLVDWRDRTDVISRSKWFMEGSKEIRNITVYCDRKGSSTIKLVKLFDRYFDLTHGSHKESMHKPELLYKT